MIVLTSLFFVQPTSGAWDKYDSPTPTTEADTQAEERLGSGPHTLIITDGEAMTKIEYKTGPQCQRARDAVRKQVAPPSDKAGRIYGPPRVKAFCVPR